MSGNPTTNGDSVSVVKAEIEHAAEPHYEPKNLLNLVLLAALVALAIYGIFSYSNVEKQRGVTEWQGKLNLIADSRAKDVSQWVQGNFKDLSTLASNPSLQLYLTELQSTSGNKTAMTDEPAQSVYLRNLLIDTGLRSGFEDRSVADARLINANVERIGQSGLAIIDNKGKVMVATPGMPPIEDELAATIKKAPKGKKSLLDMQRLDDNSVRIGFVVPISAIQNEEPGSQIGAVVGIRPLNDEFYSLLQHPGTTEKSLEAILVRKEGDTVVYLSPLKDDSKPMSKRLPFQPKKLAEAAAIANPGSFKALNDYTGQPALSTSRQVKGTGWVLVEKIAEKEALANSMKRSQLMVWILSIMLVLIVVMFIAIWHYAASKRAIDLSKRMSKLALQTAEQERLLRLVTDNQSEPIYIVDATNRYWFANRKAAEETGVDIKDMMGKMMANILGPGTAQRYMDANRNVLETSKSLVRVSRINDDDGERVIRSEHIPLERIPIENLKQPTPGVLIIDQDITEVVSERERRMRTLRQLIETLVTLVDQRDPFASHHSEHVARVARSIAIEMALEPVVVETAEISGRLMNIGKIVVPSEVLTKTTKLRDDEMQAIRESMLKSAELLGHIEFDGPVVETLRQAYENWDGSGPLHLQGESILVSARIVAVANTFIGMISQRSHRAAMDIKEATDVLLAEIDRKYDRKVVVALVNHLENHGGRAYFSKLLSAASSAA